MPSISGPIDPAAFTSTIDDPWFPLTPGTTHTLRGTKDDRAAVETFTVTARTKVIAGVTCVVTEDTVSLGGVPTEKTVGYYAQDLAGNVWYFGEDNHGLNASGAVESTDSWRTGTDGAPPALVMEAAPAVGDTSEHRYTKNNIAVLSLAEAVTVPYASYSDALVVKEWSSVEPDVVVHKYYEHGVGLVRDVTVKGALEELVLVQVEP